MNQTTADLLTIVLLLLLVGALFAVADQRDTLKAEAVKRGVAEWVVNPDNGSTTFQWKETP